MPYYCTVPRCTSMAGKAKNVSFHQFPRDEELARLWNDILKRGKPYTKYSKVCSLHFKPQDYTITSVGKNKGQWRTLRKDAVPSQNLPSETPAPYSRKQWETWNQNSGAPNIIDPSLHQQMAQAIYMQTMLAMQAAGTEPLNHQNGPLTPEYPSPHTSNQEVILKGKQTNTDCTYRCTECTKCFKDPDVFILHKRSHTKEIKTNGVEKENFNMNLTLRSNPILANLLKTNNEVSLDPNAITMESLLMSALAANMDYFRNFTTVKDDRDCDGFNDRNDSNHARNDLNHARSDLNHDRSDINHDRNDINHASNDLNHARSDLNHDRSDINHDRSDINQASNDLNHARSDLNHDKNDINHASNDLNYAKSDLNHERSDSNNDLDDLNRVRSDLNDRNVELHLRSDLNHIMVDSRPKADSDPARGVRHDIDSPNDVGEALCFDKGIISSRNSLNKTRGEVNPSRRDLNNYRGVVNHLRVDVNSSTNHHARDDLSPMGDLNRVIGPLSYAINVTSKELDDKNPKYNGNFYRERCFSGEFGNVEDKDGVSNEALGNDRLRSNCDSDLNESVDSNSLVIDEGGHL